MKNKLKLAWAFKWPVALYIISSIISQLGQLFFRSSSIQAKVTGISPWTAELMRNNEFETCFAFVLFGTIISIYGIPKVRTALGKYIPLNETALLSFLQSLEIPVQYKLDRFSKKIALILKNRELAAPKANSPESMFLEITQPEKQFNTIVEAIWYYHKLVDNSNTSFKVVLFFVEDEALDENTIYYFPRDCSPSTPPSLLADPKTAVMRSARTGKMTIIENVTKPPKDITFVRVEGDDRSGSLLCYPVKINQLNKVRMVISIFCETPNYFSRKSEAIYEFLLAPFKKRLVIEFCLLKLKEEVLTAKEAV